MTATFEKALDDLRAAYLAEVERLTEDLRDRILAGEWSGHSKDGSVAYLELEAELQRTHPLCRASPGACPACAVFAVTRWAGKFDNAGRRCGSTAAECLAADVLDLAVARGWLESRDRQLTVKVLAA